MPQGANYFLKVQVDPTSIARAQQQLRSLGNFAQSNVVQQQVQVPRAATGAVAQQQRLASIQARSVADSVQSQASSFRRLENELSGAVLASNRTAGSQLNLARATGEVGIATSRTTRQILLGQRSFRQIGTEVALVATKLTLWTAAAAGITATIGIFASLAEQILAVNDAMIGLQRVTNQTFNRDVAAAGIADNMRDLNVSATDAATAAFEMGKAYGNLRESLAASRTVLLANKVAEIDLAQASQQLVQVTNAFGLSGFQQERILDKLNAQQNTLGVNIGKTLEATARSAAVTRTAGGQLDQLVSRTAVGIRFTGFAPETVARAQARLAQQVLSSKGQGQIIDALGGSQAGQSVLEQILLPGDPSKLQNDVDKIFNTIGENFQRFDAQQKNAVSEALTGGRQGGLSVITGALLENYAIVDRQAKVSAKSQGSALKELDTVLGSIREQVGAIGTEFGLLAGNIERSGLLGVFGALLNSLKTILVVTNDIFAVFNTLPDQIQAPIAALAGSVALLRGLNKVVPGTAGGLFTAGNDIRSIRGREQAAEAARAQSIAQRFEAELAQRRIAVESEVGAIRLRNLQVEQAFRIREAQLAKLGAAGQTRINKEAQALGIVPVGQKAIPEVAPEKQVARTDVLKKLGLDASTTAAVASATEKKVAGNAAEAKSSVQVSEAELALSRATLEATAAMTLLVSSLAANQPGFKPLTAGPGGEGGAPGGPASQGRTAKLLERLSKSRFASPGALLLGGLGLSALGGAVQQAKPPGQTSIAGSGLGLAGVGLSLGFLGGPIGAGIGAGVGLGAGLLQGLVKRDKELKDQVTTSAKFFEDVTTELDDTVREVDKKLGDIEIRQPASADEVRSNLKGVRQKLIENALLPFSSFREGERERIDFTGATQGTFNESPQASRIFGKDRAAELRSQLESEDLLSSGGEGFNEEEAKRRNQLIDEALEERAKEVGKDRKALIESTTESERRIIDAFDLLTSQDPGRQQQRGKAAGALERDFRSIIDAYQGGDKDQARDELQTLFKKNEEAAAFFFENASKSQRDAVQSILDDDSFLGLGKETGANLREAVQALEDGGASAALGIQQEARTLESTVNAASINTSETLGQAVGELDSAFEDANKDFSDSLRATVLAYQVGVTGLGQFQRNLAGLAQQALADIQSSDPDVAAQGQENLLAIQQQLQSNLSDRVAQIQSDVNAGLRGEQGGQRAQINAIVQFLRDPAITQGSQAQSEGLRQLNEATAALIEQKIQSVKDRFEPQIAAATSETQKAALLGQQAAAISQIRQVDAAALGFTRQQIINAGLVVGGNLDVARINLANIGTAMIQTATNIFNSAATYGQSLFNAVVPAFIRSNQLVQGAISYLGGIRERISGLLNSAKSGLDGLRASGEGQAIKDFNAQLNVQAPSIVAPALSDANSATNAANQAAQEAASQEAAQAAKDLLAARFELLKALARGDDIKVARIGLRQAKAEARIAKTAADRLRARAGIINAQKDLRETILRERTDQIDFLLETEQITTQEAIRRLQGLLRFTKGNKDALRQLKLKIFNLTKQAQNDRTFGLPTEVPLPSILEIKRIIGTGKRIVEAQAGARAATRSRFNAGGAPSGGGATINNRNNITIVVSKDSDLKKVRSEINKATGQTIQRNTFIGATPGFF